MPHIQYMFNWWCGVGSGWLCNQRNRWSYRPARADLALLFEQLSLNLKCSIPVKIVSLHTTDEIVTITSGDECSGLELLTYSYTIEPFNKSLAGPLTGPLTGLNREDPPDTRLHSRQLKKALTKPEVVFIFLFLPILYLIYIKPCPRECQGKGHKILDPWHCLTNSISPLYGDCTNPIINKYH